MIYLIRHGQTAWNQEKRFQGIMDVALDDTGIKQAMRLSEHFKGIPITSIYSSDLSRAKDTAIMINQYHNVSLHVDPRIRELDVGIWEGMRWDTIKDTFSDFIKASHATGYTIPIPQGESLVALRNRSASFLKEITEKHRDESVVVVTHGGVIRMLLLEVNQQELSFYNQTVLHNGSVTTLSWSEETSMWKVQSLNDLSHLENRTD